MVSSINNSVTNTPPVTGSTAEKQTATTTAGTGTNSGNEQSQAVENDIKLSSRARKVQMLNEEFFSAGPSSVKITPEFLQRLQEYGFISEKEAESLGALKTSSAGAEGTLGELSNAIEDLSQRLKEESPDDNLLSILERSDAIINNLDGSKPSNLAANIKTVSAELNAYLDSSDAEKLSDEEKESMTELSLALEIANRLNPNNVSSQQLNSYLSFA